MVKKKRPIKAIVLDKKTKKGARVRSFSSLDSKKLQELIARSVKKARRTK